jgi:hypothetical protein
MFIVVSSDLGPSKSVIFIPTLASLENKPGSGFLVFLTILSLLEHAEKNIMMGTNKKFFIIKDYLY